MKDENEKHVEELLIENADLKRQLGELIKIVTEVSRENRSLKKSIESMTNA